MSMGTVSSFFIKVESKVARVEVEDAAEREEGGVFLRVAEDMEEERDRGVVVTVSVNIY